MRRLLLRTSILAALPLGAAVLGAQVQQGVPAEQTTLQPGDAVRITVWRRPELSGEFTLGADGAILHPLYRVLRVGGVPLAVAEQRVGAFLAQFEATPAFVLEPLVRVVLSGQVTRPNVYALRSETTIAQAVAGAGGVTERGDLRAAQLMRGGQTRRFDLTRPDDPVALLPIRSGDQIIVGRQRAIFREVVTPALTVVAAVAAVANVVIRAQK